MAHYFSFLAALFFSIAHILIRRGLVHSNAMTCSFISLTISAVVLLVLVPFFVPYMALRNPGIRFFIAAGIFAPGIGCTLGYVGIERIGVARSVPLRRGKFEKSFSHPEIGAGKRKTLPPSLFG